MPTAPFDFWATSLAMLTAKTIQWLRNAVLALVLGLLCIQVAPQQPVPDDLADDPNLPREVRIQRHNLRMQKLMEEAKATANAAAETQKVTVEGQQLLISPPQPTPPRPQPTPPSGVTAPGAPSPGVRPPTLAPGVPPQPGAPPPAPSATTQIPFRLSRAIVYLHPFQVLSRVGDTFETEIQVYNSSAGGFDEIALHLKYDPLVIAPERVNDSPIYKLVAGSPWLRVNRSKGELHYQARLRETISKTTTTLLTVHWQALNPAFYSEIRFVSGDEGTRIGKSESNILGFVAGGRQEGGMLPGGVIISPRDDSPRNLIPPFGEIVVASIHELVSLHLEADPESLGEGEMWIVDLTLRNQASVPFNEMCARMFFDSTKLQVVDWHSGNWIRQGINIQDGFAHEDYPFDVFYTNSADNERGEILYHVGSRAAHIFPSGVLARIKFKALAEASLDDVWFDFEDPKRSGGAVETDVSFLGSTVMYAPRRKIALDERPAPEPLRRPD